MSENAEIRSCFPDPAPLAAAGSDALQEGILAAARKVESVLDGVLPMPREPYGRVQKAMRYAVFGSGKRLRPFLTMRCADLFDVPIESSVRVAAAIEILHCYSLVHDDLPCMDDDDLRRGRATVHRRFDEATALLAGDGLLTLSFQILSATETHGDPSVRCDLVSLLSAAAGSDGLIGGQMMDMLAPHCSFTMDDVLDLQAMKTGALFQFCCEAAAILGYASDVDRGRLRSFGQNLGALFQIADDLIDVAGTEPAAGKAVGKDADQGKATLVSLLGIDGARARAQRYGENAAQALEAFGENGGELRRLPFHLLDRVS